MKTLAKSLVLVLLVAVICSASYIAVTAAEDFSADERMADTAPLDAAGPGTSLGGVKGTSDLESAPALRIDYYNINAETTLTPLADAPETETPDAAPETTSEEMVPNTGLGDFGPQIAVALVLLGGALAAKKKEKILA